MFRSSKYLLIFLSTSFIYYWEKSVEVSKYNYGFVYFSFQKKGVRVLKSIARCIHIEDCCIVLMNWSFYEYVMFLLFVVIFFALKCILSHIKYYCSSLLISVCMVYLYYPFSFNLLISLYLKFILDSKYVGRVFFFLIHFRILSLLYDMLRPFTFNSIIGMFIFRTLICSCPPF